MAQGLSIQLEGMEELQALFRRFPDHANDGLKDIVAKTAFAARQRMIAGAPRGETGRLKASITARTRGTSGFVELQKEAFYWRFVEYGTKRMKKGAQPFIRPARELEALAMSERIRQFARRMERDFSTGRFL